MAHASGLTHRPGRRRLLAALAGSLLLAGVGAAPVNADQSPTVVQATVYAGGGQSVQVVSLSLAKLEACPPYAGQSVYLHPGGQPVGPTAYSWTVGTVVSCALRVPVANVDGVQIESPARGFEAPLTSAQLTDPNQFHDPSGPGALPFVSVDGNEDQTTYERPWLGGSDANGNDQVIAAGSPLDLVVFEHGATLAVTASSRRVSQTSTTLTEALSATVRSATGSTIPASDLSWAWNFGDGQSSTLASPRHTFTEGVSVVTVQVTEVHAGSGGTDTISVTFSPSGHSGHNPGPGAGKNHHSTAPNGPVHSNGKQSGARSGRSSHNASHTSRTTTTTHTTTTPASTTTPAPTTTTTRPATSTAAAPSPPQPRPPDSSRHPALETLSGSVVSGRLISDVRVIPLEPAAATAGAAAATAPPVRAAGSPSVLAAVLAALAVLALFGSGAARELAGVTGWRPWRKRP